MLPFIVTADWHIGKNLYGKIDPKTGFHTQDDQLICSIVQLIEYAKSHNIKHVFVAGDIFHKRNPASIDWEVLNIIISLFIDAEIYLHISPGNHDDLNVHTTALNPLFNAQNPYIDYVATQKSFLINDDKYPGVLRSGKYDVEVLMFSYASRRWTPRNPSNPFVELLEKLPEKTTRYRVCLCHEMISGAVSNKIIHSSSLSPSLLQSKFDLTVAGHVHEYQEVKPGILYCGPLTHSDFGDRMTRPGFVVVGTTPKNPSTPIKGLQGYYSENELPWILCSMHIPITTRKFIRFEGTVTEVIKSLKEDQTPEAVIKLIAHDKVTQIAKLNQQVKELELNNRVIVIESHPIKTERIRKKIDTTSTIKDQFLSYTEGESQDIIDLGLHILDEVEHDT